MADRDNTGILFPNDRKQKQNHPDYKGKATIDGVEYWLSGWKKKGAKGPFLSLAVEPKEKRESQTDEPYGVDTDDIPF